MRKVAVAALLLFGMCAFAVAAEPTGEWVVRDGSARVRIEPCADALWGVIAWTRYPGGIDSKNPNPAKRNRPIVGVPILRAMKPAAPNKWEGEVYDARSGKVYSANITLVRDDVLKVEGCVLGGVFCDGENWTRVQPDQTATATPKPQERPASGRPGAKSAPAPAPAATPAREVCYDE
jgi:uncharacterized protein (DUF2147 family)